MILMVFYYMDQKKDLSSHTPIKKIDMVAVRLFLKSIGLLKRGSIFYALMQHLDLMTM